jgi:hypothetical protein
MPTLPHCPRQSLSLPQSDLTTWACWEDDRRQITTNRRLRPGRRIAPGAKGREGFTHVADTAAIGDAGNAGQVIGVKITPVVD